MLLFIVLTQADKNCANYQSFKICTNELQKYFSWYCYPMYTVNEHVVDKSGAITDQTLVSEQNVCVQLKVVIMSFIYP